MTSEQCWRDTLSSQLISQIELAVDQAKADLDYEMDWPLKETLQRLRAIHSHCEKLKDAIANLSPVGRSALWTLAREGGARFGRDELLQIDREIAKLSPLADSAVGRLLHMHSPLADEGQGSGSAVGRDSDLRAIRVGEGQRSNGVDIRLDQLSLRSPKDKFAFSVIRALVHHGHPITEPDFPAQRKSLESLLAAIWKESGIEQRASWENIGAQRHLLFELAMAEFAAILRARMAAANRNHLAPKRRR